MFYSSLLMECEIVVLIDYFIDELNDAYRIL
jgi:hypothetical protein